MPEHACASDAPGVAVRLARPRRPLGAAPLVLECAIAVAMVALALAVRLPYHQLIPAFTDETEEVYESLRILRGESLPLVDESTQYNGALWVWLVAAAFHLSGSSLLAPRTLVLALGILTVAATYLLGRAWGGRIGGTLAAALLATAPTHVVVNSQIAWSNSTTPLFTTVAVWALYAATRGQTPTAGGRMLALSAVFWGLALQTHPSVATFVPAAGAFVLWRVRGLLRTVYAPLAAGLFVLSCSNLIVYNVASGFRSVAEGIKRAATYSQQEQLSPVVYARRSGELFLSLFRSLGGAVDARPTGLAFLLDPALWAVALLALAAVLWSWRRGNPLPLLLLGSMAALLPLLRGTYELMRYTAPLLPVLYAAIGALTADLTSRAARGAPGRHLLAWLEPRRAGMALAIGFLVVHPLLYLRAYYDQELAAGRTNTEIWRALEALASHRSPGHTVLLDSPLQDKNLPSAGSVLRILRLAFELSGVDYRRYDLVQSGSAITLAYRCRDTFVILGPRKRQVRSDLVRQLELKPLARATAAGGANGSLLVGPYRLARLPGTHPDCAEQALPGGDGIRGERNS